MKKMNFYETVVELLFVMVAALLFEIFNLHTLAIISSGGLITLAILMVKNAIDLLKSEEEEEL